MSNMNDNYDECFNKAILLLSLRFHTTYEMKKKLLGKFGKKTIEKVVDRLIELRYLDDEKFVNLYLEQNLDRKSRLNIFQNLIKKGIDKDTINVIFYEHPITTELCAAKNDLRKKSFDMNSKNDREKAMSFLSRKGYNYSTIKSVVDNEIN